MREREGEREGGETTFFPQIVLDEENEKSLLRRKKSKRERVPKRERERSERERERERGKCVCGLVEDGRMIFFYSVLSVLSLNVSMIKLRRIR